MIEYNVTAFDLKLALLEYYRFKRQCVCVDEFRGADILVDTGKDIIEVEVKISKYDLMNGERRKSTKHHCYRMGQSYARFHPNKYMFCVPLSLEDSARAICEELNPKYGIITFARESFWKHIQMGYGIFHSNYLTIVKSARRLHETYTPNRKSIAMRTSSKLVALMKAEFRRNLK